MGQVEAQVKGAADVVGGGLGPQMGPGQPWPGVEQPGHIADQGQILPAVFVAVQTEKQEQILGAEGVYGVPAQADRRPARPGPVKVEGREVGAAPPFPLQVDGDPVPVGEIEAAPQGREGIQARGVDVAVAQLLEHPAGGTHILGVDQEIQISGLPQPGRPVDESGQHRAFERDGPHPGLFQSGQNFSQTLDQELAVDGPGEESVAQPLPGARGHGVQVFVEHAPVEDGQQALGVGQMEQGRPVHTVLQPGGNPLATLRMLTRPGAGQQQCGFRGVSWPWGLHRTSSFPGTVYRGETNGRRSCQCTFSIL